MRKKVLALVLALVMVIAMLPTVAFAADFADTKGHWAETQIDRWSDFGVVGGDGTGFNPNGSMTRAQAAQVFVNLLKLTKAGDIAAYTDVPATAWYADAISKVVEKGIMNGVSATTMNPEGTLTREQMFVMIGRALGVKPVETATKTFVDGKETSDWATGYINALADMGVIHGTGNNELNPTDVINRASVMTALDNLIGGYANEDGQTVEIQEGKITLIVADDVKVTGEADPDMPIVVAGAAKTVDLEGVTVTGEEAPVVQVQVEEVAIENAPEGTNVAAPAEATDVTVNGETVEAGSTAEAPAPEAEQTAPSQQGTTPVPQPAPAEPTPSEHKNEAEAAMNAAWEALDTALDDMGELVVASQSNGTYTLTINFDKLTSTDKVLDGDGHGLATAIGEALKTHLNGISLTVGGEDVYTAEGKFNNTALKHALFTVAGGFFYDLGNLPESGEFRSVEGTATANNCTQSDKCTYDVTLKVVLTGEKLTRVKDFAKKLSDYVSMTKINASDVASKYGTIQGLTGESEYIVVCLDKLPQTLLTKVGQAYRGDSAQTAFEGASVEALLTLLAQQTMDGSLAEIETLARMINTNEGLIDTVLGHVSAKVLVGGETKDLITMGSNYTPYAGSVTDFAKLVKGVNALLTSDAKSLKPSQFKVTQGSTTGKYIVPVTVHIDLESSLGFTADETILVELNIDLSSVNTSGK